MLDPKFQPALESVLARLGEEISARAVLLFQEDGQVLHSAGPMSASEIPIMAALVAAMIATGKSLGNLGDAFPGNPSRFSCDSEMSGIYLVEVEPGIWLSALYDQPLNPGKLRLRVRQTARICGQLGIQRAQRGSFLSTTTTSSTNASASISAMAAAKPLSSTTSLSASSPSATLGTSGASLLGANSTPVVKSHPQDPEKITDANSNLFTNITDDEIDRLFENPSS